MPYIFSIFFRTDVPYWDAAFHVAGTITQLVGLPNENILYSTDVGYLQVDSGLCRVFTMRIFIVIPSWIPVEAL